MHVKLEKQTPALERFAIREWKKADKEHYGPGWNFKTKEYVFVARDKKDVIGTATLRAKAGVGEVKTVLVAEKKRGEGIGHALMGQVERMAKKNKLHKLWLNTGKGWKAQRFYEKLGYVVTADLKKHYAKTDFVIYTKYL